MIDGMVLGKKALGGSVGRIEDGETLWLMPLPIFVSSSSSLTPSFPWWSFPRCSFWLLKV